MLGFYELEKFKWMKKNDPFKKEVLKWNSQSVKKKITSPEMRRYFHVGLNGICMCARMLMCGQLFATPSAVAHQTPLSIEYSWQEHWSGVSFPPPGALPTPGTEPASPSSPAGFFATWEAPKMETVFLPKIGVKDTFHILNVCVILKFIYWNPNPSFWWYLDVEGL